MIRSSGNCFLTSASLSSMSLAELADVSARAHLDGDA